MKSFLTIYTISGAKCKRAAKYKSKHPNWVQRGCFWSRKAKSPDKLLKIYSEREKKSSTQLVHFHSLLRRRGNITKVLVRFFSQQSKQMLLLHFVQRIGLQLQREIIISTFHIIFHVKKYKKGKKNHGEYSFNTPNTV